MNQLASGCEKKVIPFSYKNNECYYLILRKFSRFDRYLYYKTDKEINEIKYYSFGNKKWNKSKEYEKLEIDFKRITDYYDW